MSIRECNGRIYNFLRGSGENTKERGILLTMRQCREHRKRNRISWVIKTDLSKAKTKAECDKESQPVIRTMLWP